jgi:hypothetical protein
MGILLDDPLYERFATRALSHALYGGADFGVCFVTAKQITPADSDSWQCAWTATAGRVFAIAQGCAASGHAVSAGASLLGAPEDEQGDIRARLGGGFPAPGWGLKNALGTPAWKNRWRSGGGP